MTPLARFYTRFMPPSYVWFALTISYAFGILLLFVFGGQSLEDVIYIDIGVGK
jgi:hypothetical protein